MGLPIQVQKGNVITRYEYDACGNCIAMRDGDGRVVRQTFDGLRRLIKKELPDGGCVEFVYDQDSNIAEYHLPNGMVWKASYDSMKRKTEEQLQVGNLSSLHWEYTYENGYLKEVKDPMERIRFYLYDLNGRLVQESVDGWQRSFTYDPRGLLLSAQQSAPHSEHSNIERSYDPDGRLILENIYLNSRLIQETKQEWDALGRSLQINGHTRNFTYQNNQLVEIAMQETCLSYAYNRSGSLKQKSTPYGDVNIDYNLSGLPANICAKDMYEETLLWHPSGKLAAHLSPHDYKQFTYTDRGYLQSAGSEQYSFDFGMAGIGIRTQAPDRVVSENGLDPFGKIVMEINEVGSVATAYNLMGEVISQNSKKFQWDPWGRLLKVSDETSLWEASYDALGRRLQTHYTIEEHPQISTTSFYDPEQEFLEIGVQCEGKTFWKIYGPNSCDAIIDETGDSVVLLHNGLGHLVGVISKQGIMDVEQISSYGSQVLPSLPVDLLSYAKTFTWHSQALDPTGLVWMGARYYDPHGGRFLSPDPIGYPVCLDLYAYSAGDPINYMDPDGRFASSVYQTIKPVVIGSFQPFYGINQSIQAFNVVPAYLANQSMTRSEFFQVGSFDLSQGGIGFINGINNQRDESIASALQVSQYGGGAKVYGIYNATNWDSIQAVSIGIDIIECSLGHMRVHTPPVQLLKNQWNHFIATHGPEEKFLQFSHSGGALHVLNALLTSPKSVQQRIISVAFAPAAIIPEELCFKSYNYMSRRDIVTRLDIMGQMKYRDQLEILEPHPNAFFWDHGFLSPTFDDVKRRHISDYIQKYGSKK